MENYFAKGLFCWVILLLLLLFCFLFVRLFVSRSSAKSEKKRLRVAPASYKLRLGVASCHEK